MKLRGYVLGIISAISYGLLPIFILPIKHAHFSLDVTLFYRFLFSALMIGGYLLYSKESFLISKKRIIDICCSRNLLCTFLRIFIFRIWLSYPRNCINRFVYLSSYCSTHHVFLYKEKLTKLSIGSLLLAFAGVIILCLKGNSLEINYLGLGIVMLSSLFYALYIVIVNKSNIQASGFKLSFYSMLFTSGFLWRKQLWEANHLSFRQ